MDAWLLTGDDLAYLVEVVWRFVGYGLGIGAVMWVIGALVTFVWDFVRY